METTMITIAAILALFTISYKLIPHRVAGTKKPVVAFLPKYRKRIRHELSEKDVCSIVSGLGFTPIAETESLVAFTRGSIAGDILAKFVKTIVKIRKKNTGELELTVEAGWFVAFDTGDFWALTTELCDKLEHSNDPAPSTL